MHRHFLNALGILLIIAVLIAVLYVQLFHRIRTLSDFKLAAKIISLPKFNNRCKLYNTSHFICLPNIFLIGASKCGTTTLMKRLLGHPNIYRVRRRISPTDNHTEIHRFDRWSYGWALKSIELADEWASSPIVPSITSPVIHYTPHYLYAPTVPFELREFDEGLSDVKFIISLREPIERALSSYWFQNSRRYRNNKYHSVRNGTTIGIDQDLGTLTEFEKLAINEMKYRHLYDTCIDQEKKKQLLLLQKRFKEYTGKNADNQLRRCRNFICNQNNLVYNNKSRISFTYKEELCCSNSLSVDETYSIIKKCFGSKYLRSSSLGSRHLDKGIYYDQIERWLLNFPKNNFHFMSLHNWGGNPNNNHVSNNEILSTSSRLSEFSSLEYLQNSGLSVQEFEYKKLLKFIFGSTETSEEVLNYSVRKMIDSMQSMLVKPNSRSNGKSHVENLSKDFTRQLEMFYRPYNDKLYAITGFNLSIGYTAHIT